VAGPGTYTKRPSRQATRGAPAARLCASHGEIAIFKREERVPEPGETERARRRGEEPYSRTVTTPGGGIAKGSPGYWDAFY
jgi:hypothetical protein